MGTVWEVYGSMPPANPKSTGGQQKGDQGWCFGRQHVLAGHGKPPEIKRP